MIKNILSIALLATSLAVSAQTDTSHKLYLGKGDKTVASFEMNDGDYITFTRPQNMATTMAVELTNVKAGKNYINYKVNTKKQDQIYGHMLLQASFLDLFLTQYYNTSLSTVSEDVLKEALKTLFASGYGYVDQGAKTFSIKDCSTDSKGNTLFIPAGQEYFIVTVDANENYEMGNELSYVKVKTQEPGESTETLNVTYKGIDETGVHFGVEPSAGIVALYTVFGTKKSIDEFVNVYSYDYLMFTQGLSHTVAQWKENEPVAKVERENDYSFYVLGIDKNGDWVKAQLDEHIKPLQDSNCPIVDVLANTVTDGHVTVTFGVTPKDVKKATVRLILDNDLQDELNRNKTLPEIAAEGATDVTATVNAEGEYTFDKDNLERGWYSLLCSATGDKGTTVTRASFHSHLDNAEWEILSKQFPNETTPSQIKTLKSINGSLNINKPCLTTKHIILNKDNKLR